MNRRSFIGGFAAALAGFTVLPAATTYTRLWKAVKDDLPYWEMVPNPEYVNAEYEVYFYDWSHAVLRIDPLHLYPIRFTEQNGVLRRVEPLVSKRAACIFQTDTVPPYLKVDA